MIFENVPSHVLPVSKKTPIHCFIKPCEQGNNADPYIVIVYGIDIYGILSHIVGAMSLQQIEICSAISKNYMQDDTRMFYNEFIVDAHNAYTDSWQSDVVDFIHSQGVLLYANKRTQASSHILEHIAEDYAKNVTTLGHPPIIDMHIGDSSDNGTFEIQIEGRDSRYLLYMLSMALEQQCLFVNSFSITTVQSHIRDTFIVQPYENTVIEKLQLRVKLVLTNTTYVLYKICS